MTVLCKDDFVEMSFKFVAVILFLFVLVESEPEPHKCDISECMKCCFMKSCLRGECNEDTETCECILMPSQHFLGNGNCTKDVCSDKKGT